MKVDLYVLDDNDEPKWVDFYIPKKEMIGFYIPFLCDEDLPEESVNVYIGSSFITLKQTPELLKHLNTKEIIDG